jgi:lauroyl/myristoyl acyltransferase|uniref:Lipid A biosynthesis acyltransferase n=1 Tax=Desulfobacca acetoxidans TaxID=60893 RepID=A0A7V6A155_9BACT
MLPGIKISWKFSLNLSKFCQARFNVFLFRFLPFWVSRWYLTQIGKLYYFFKAKEKNLIRATIRHTFGADLEPGSLRSLVKNAFQGIIDHYHEKLFVAYSNFPRLLKFLRNRIKLNGQEELEAILAQGRGIILVTGHYGAVEFLPGALAVRGYPTTMICRFQTNRLKKSLHQRAEAVGLQLVDPEDGNVFVAAIKALKSGRILITECDEFDEWRPSPGSTVTFLNSHLTGDKTLDILQKRSGAPVVSALMQRNGRKRYTLNLTPVLTDPSEGEAPGKACLKVLETSIQADPAHWYQWKKFGQMLDLDPEDSHDHQESGHLAPELQVPVPVSA